MKKINNLIKMLVLCGGLFFASCETTELDLTQNPNALTPEQGDPDFYLNAIQIDWAYWVESFGRTAGAVTRIDYMSGRDYANAYAPTSFDGRWSSAYQNMMLDIKEMNKIAEEGGLTHHTAISQVIEAHILVTLVDIFGDVPYSEAFQGGDNLNPVADSGASVYAAAEALLDAAIVNFSGDAVAEPAMDMYYGGNWAKWIKAANTLKMKMYMTTRLVDGSAVSKFNAIVASGNYISANDDDLQFGWGTNEVQPDSRHPRYRDSYTATGGEDYMSNSLMHYMIGQGYFSPSYDPRINFYYSRQVSVTPGIDGADTNEEVIECGLVAPPAHYDGYVFCGNVYGYWGRDHGNDNGTPPDGFLRTLAGVYPAGGVLDDWSVLFNGSQPQKNGDGNGGNGVTPIMLASWADFMIAEAALFVDGDETASGNAMLSGIAKSFDKVTTFSTLTDLFVTVTDVNFGGLNRMIADFTGNIVNQWSNADMDGKKDILSMQYFVAQYGNGLDPYNFYRRTGYPTTLQPNLEANPGGFIRSFWYPAAHANTNVNINQKDGVTSQVFWDTNPGSPGFPASN